MAVQAESVQQKCTAAAAQVYQWSQRGVLVMGSKVDGIMNPGCCIGVDLEFQ